MCRKKYQEWILLDLGTSFYLMLHLTDCELYYKELWIFCLLFSFLILRGTSQNVFSSKSHNLGSTHGETAYDVSEILAGAGLTKAY